MPPLIFERQGHSANRLTTPYIALPALPGEDGGSVVIQNETGHLFPEKVIILSTLDLHRAIIPSYHPPYRC